MNKDKEKQDSPEIPTAHAFFIGACLLSLSLVPFGDEIGGSMGMWIGGAGFVVGSLLSIFGIAYLFTGGK